MIMMKPLVSIIIPTYNRQDFIKEAVESVLTQDYSCYELIVVDDGSTDTTRSILARYPEIMYCYQENRGVSSARNHGLACSQGNLIAFLDSDDLWLPRKLSTQVALMERSPEIMVTYTDEVWIRQGKRVNSGKRHQKYSGWIFKQCLPLCIVSPSSVVVRKQVFEIVGNFDEHLPVCEDYDLWLRLAAQYPIHFVAEKLIVKRGGHHDQLSHRFWGNDRFRVEALQKIIRNPLLGDENKITAVQELMRKCGILENGFRKRGNTMEADHYQRLIQEHHAWLTNQLS